MSRKSPREWALVLLLWGLLYPGAASAQESQALPHDALSLLQYQKNLEGLAPAVRASETRTLERAYVYFLAGAEGELRNEIRNLTEDQPDALRFALQADCWSTHTYADGRRRADSWLAQYSDRSDAEVGAVKAVQVWLQDAETRRISLREERGRSRWYPLAAGFGVLLLVWLLVRRLP
ncbi:MAG: hypothetical protein ACPG31_07090 [Planctomycetota bacterium]